LGLLGQICCLSPFREAGQRKDVGSGVVEVLELRQQFELRHQFVEDANLIAG
jgi:hypothetical protein